MGIEFEQDLRYTSDEMLRALERLRELEARKRHLQPGTPHFLKLAEEVHILAREVFAETTEQQRLAEQSVELREATVIDPPPIDDMPPVRELQIILGEWREAERRLEAAAPGTDEVADARADTEKLRQEYRQAAQRQWSEAQPE
ncbi:hypothetical protein BH24CHL7_BH24CHL7_12250 [soil metagenome]